jgi:hypothetical protein
MLQSHLEKALRNGSTIEAFVPEGQPKSWLITASCTTSEQQTASALMLSEQVHY